jgi:hypothetical protein
MGWTSAWIDLDGFFTIVAVCSVSRLSPPSFYTFFADVMSFLLSGPPPLFPRRCCVVRVPVASRFGFLVLLLRRLHRFLIRRFFHLFISPMSLRLRPPRESDSCAVFAWSSRIRIPGCVVSSFPRLCPSLLCISVGSIVFGCFIRQIRRCYLRFPSSPFLFRRSISRCGSAGIGLSPHRRRAVSSTSSSSPMAPLSTVRFVHRFLRLLRLLRLYRPFRFSSTDFSLWSSTSSHQTLPLLSHPSLCIVVAVAFALRHWDRAALCTSTSYLHSS